MLHKMESLKKMSVFTFKASCSSNVGTICNGYCKVFIYWLCSISERMLWCLNGAACAFSRGVMDCGERGKDL